MNFLAHLFLAGDDEGLRLGAMLADFVRGSPDVAGIPLSARKGIVLHRFTDQFIDVLPEMVPLCERFKPPFRRYSGIIIDLALDHELALRWDVYSTVSLQQFDRDVRDLLARYETVLPEKLQAFMLYADRRGLFAAYRNEAEVLLSLQDIGRRLRNENPLGRVADIWVEVKPIIRQAFNTVFPQVQQAVSDWLQKSDAEQVLV